MRSSTRASMSWLWVLVLIVLVGSGVSKFIEPSPTLLSVTSLRILPAGWTPAFVQVLATVEVASGLLVAVPNFRAPALLASATLFALFAANNLWSVLFDELASCGCFGTWLSLGPKVMLPADLLLFAISLWLWRPRDPAHRLQSPQGGFL